MSAARRSPEEAKDLGATHTTTPTTAQSTDRSSQFLAVALVTFLLLGGACAAGGLYLVHTTHGPDATQHIWHLHSHELPTAGVVGVTRKNTSRNASSTMLPTAGTSSTGTSGGAFVRNSRQLQSISQTDLQALTESITAVKATNMKQPGLEWCNELVGKLNHRQLEGLRDEIQTLNLRSRYTFMRHGRCMMDGHMAGVRRCMDQQPTAIVLVPEHHHVFSATTLLQAACIM